MDGTIASIEPNGVIVDLENKKTGFVPAYEISKSSGVDISDVVEVGEKLSFMILGAMEGQIILSLKALGSWEQLRRRSANNDTVFASVASVFDTGVIVHIYGITGFVPQSHLRILDVPGEKLIRSKIALKILELDERHGKLFLSQLLALQDQQKNLRLTTLSNLKEEQLIGGKVVRIAKFAVFVDLGGIEGMLPMSEISDENFMHPFRTLQLGEIVTVKILKIDEVKEHITLSLKHTTSDVTGSTEQ